MGKSNISETNEEWEDVPGYTGYSISDLGRIMGPGKNHYGNQILNPMKSDTGHLYIFTKRPGVPRKLFIHKAVLMAFKGLCPQGKEARHLDGKPSHNYPSNLEWGDRFEQREDCRRHGTLPVGEKCGKSKLKEEDVFKIRTLRGTATARGIAKQYGVSHTAILSIFHGNSWSHI